MGGTTDTNVTPYAGVWIEITGFRNTLAKIIVTPYAGVWIEIWILSNMSLEKWSLPTRECGLK